jgi:hypothetical protein
MINIFLIICMSISGCCCNFTFGCCTGHHIHHTEAQGVKWTETVSDYSFPASST